MKKRIEIITRIIIFISTFVAIAGCLMTMLTININLMGKNLYSQNVGIISLIKKDSTGGIIDKLNSLGLQNLNDFYEKILKVMILPVSLYLAAMLLVIIVMICTLVNKLCRLKMLLSIVATVVAVYLISVMQDLPSKLIQSLSLNKILGIFDLSKFVEINVGIGHWIMLVAIIIMMISTIFHFVIVRSKSISKEGV